MAAAAAAKKLQTERKELRVYQFRDLLLEAIERYQVLIINGRSGCGKTTQIPQYLHEAGYTTRFGGGKKKKIGCTLPRESAAAVPRIAARVAQEMGLRLGHEVVYSLPPNNIDEKNSQDSSNKPTNSTSTKRKRSINQNKKGTSISSTGSIRASAGGSSSDGAGVMIKYMTNAVLLGEIVDGEADLESYSVVIVDDATERTLSTDILFGLLRKIARSRRECGDFKLLISCARGIDCDKLRGYFSDLDGEVFRVPGFGTSSVRFLSEWPSEAEEPWPPEAQARQASPLEKLALGGGDWDDYLSEEAVWTALMIHRIEPPGDILIFLPSQGQIQSVHQRLIDRMAQDDDDQTQTPQLMIVNSISPQCLLHQCNQLVRKVVFATSIAETWSFTYNIQYVIDSGLHAVKSYDPITGVESLRITPISHASAERRHARASKMCFRLYTERDYHHLLPEFVVPEVQRTANLANVVLVLKRLGIHDVFEFAFPDPPPPESLAQALEQLIAIGALEHDGLGHLTPLGIQMADTAYLSMQ